MARALLRAPTDMKHSSFSNFLVLALVLGISMIACGSESSNSPSKNVSTATPAVPNEPDRDGNESDDTSTSSTAPSPSPSASAPTSSDADANPSATTPDASADCNALVNDAPAVSGAETIAAAPPTATGGVIATGTYHLVAMKLFTGPEGDAGALDALLMAYPIRTTVAIQNGVMDMVVDFNGGEQRRHGTFVTTGSTFAGTPTCPAGPTASSSYSATATTIIMYEPTGTGQVWEQHFERVSP